MSDYEPGTVATATVRGVPNVRVMYRGQEFAFPWASGLVCDGSKKASLHLDSEVADVRQLVAIDLPLGALGGWDVLVEALRIAARKTGLTSTFGGLIDQIEAQVVPPKPTEPKTTGAIVHDSDTEAWVRHSNGEWACLQSKPGDDVRTWDDLCDAYGPIEVEQP